MTPRTDAARSRRRASGARLRPAFGARSAARFGALALVGIGMAAALALGPAVARPVRAAEPTMSPFESGRHLYDYGSVFSTRTAATAEALAQDIETRGGGRVVVFTSPEPQDVPDAKRLAGEWQADGMVLVGAPDSYGNLALGSTLAGKLSKEQADAIEISPGPFTLESWVMSSLARADAFLSGSAVFDGTGVLDAATKSEAEAAVKGLSGSLKAPVYVDISLGGDDASAASFFNVAHLSSAFDNGLVIALSVSGTTISGDVQTGSSDLWDKYKLGSPWSTVTLMTQAGSEAEVPATLLRAIKAVGSSSIGSVPLPGGGSLDFETLFWIIFAIAMVLIGVGSPFYGGWLIRKISGVSAPVKDGLPGEALIESITDTGTTVTMPETGPDAPEYKFGLQIWPLSGAAPYEVETKAFVPRIFMPMVVPGAKLRVLIDPKDPTKVSIDFSQSGALAGSSAGSSAGIAVASPALAMAGAGAAGASGSAGGMDIAFDAGGQPLPGQVATLVGAVRSGQLPTIKGSADQLLATGTHGTAVITSAQPLGKKVRDVNPAAPAERLDDPVWVFTVEVTVAGEKPFPAVFGHRVPLAKLASVVPGAKLAVAVDLFDRSNEVAIDWDRSPLPG